MACPLPRSSSLAPVPVEQYRQIAAPTAPAAPLYPYPHPFTQSLPSVPVAAPVNTAVAVPRDVSVAVEVPVAPVSWSRFHDLVTRLEACTTAAQLEDALSTLMAHDSEVADWYVWGFLLFARVRVRCCCLWDVSACPPPPCFCFFGALRFVPSPASAFVVCGIV